MSCAIAIMLTFRPQGKAVQTIGGANGIEPVLSPREQFMHVTLVAYVPDEFVVRRGKNAVQCQSQLDHAKIGTKMASILGQFGNQLVADFSRQLIQLVRR